MKVNKELISYIESHIILHYNKFDASHSPAHIYQVINNSFDISKNYNVKDDIVYTVAAYHDIGMLTDRKNHEIHSRIYLENDTMLKSFFTEEEIRLMGEAVEDHRASISYEPRSIYGKIISEADRDIDFSRILTRTIQFALTKKHILDKEVLFKEAYEYVDRKYGPNSNIKFWLNYKKNVDNLKEIHNYLDNKDKFRKSFDLIYSLELKSVQVTSKCI